MERYVPTKYTGLGQMEKEHEGLNTRFKWEIPLKRWRVCYSVLVRQATSATESNNKRWPHTQHPTHSILPLCLLHCITFFSGFPFRINAERVMESSRRPSLASLIDAALHDAFRRCCRNAMRASLVQGTQHWPCSLLYSLHPAALCNVPLMDFLIVRSPPQNLAIKRPAVLPPSEQRLPFSCDY